MLGEYVLPTLVMVSSAHSAVPVQYFPLSSRIEITRLDNVIMMCTSGKTINSQHREVCLQQSQSHMHCSSLNQSSSLQRKQDYLQQECDLSSQALL